MLKFKKEHPGHVSRSVYLTEDSVPTMWSCRKHRPGSVQMNTAVTNAKFKSCCWRQISVTWTHHLTSEKQQKLHKIKGREPGRPKKREKKNWNLPRSLNISIYKVVAMVTGHIHGQWSRFTQRIKAQSYHLSGSQSLKVESRAAQRSIPKFCTADSISSSNSEDLTMTAREKQHSSSEGQGLGKRSRAAFLNRWITNHRNVLVCCLLGGNCIKRVKS